MGCCCVHRAHTGVVWIPFTNWQSLDEGAAHHLPTARRRTSSWREQKDLLTKRLTLALYQTLENPMAPMFHYFHCSQDSLFNFCFFAMPGGQQIQDFFVQGNAWTQIPSPKGFQLTVQQPKALPVTSWAHCCRWGCCLCFQQGLGFHPLWLQSVPIFPLINTTAFWGRPIFLVLLKNHKKLPGKIKDCKCTVVQSWLHFK